MLYIVEQSRVLQMLYIVEHVSERGLASSPYSTGTQHKKSAKSDSAVREENQGTRKPREQQKTNEMHDCA